MREIKFRGYSPIYGKWFFGCYTYVKLQNSHYVDDFLVHHKTVGQYTGLKDKNGVEIYEGDIVLIAGCGECLVEFPFIGLYDACSENDIGEIVYKDGR